MPPVNTDPKRTLALLAELENLGFGDEAFAVLHHFKNHTIAQHREYCLQTGTFTDDGENPLVQRRLETVLSAYRAGGFRNPTAFTSLAQAALVEYPLRKPQREPW